MSGRIILCEPQCIGFEHATANAALLSTVLLAYPQHEVTFLGEPEHLRWVREALCEQHVEATRVDWQSLVVPPRSLSGWRRMPGEVRWCRQTLRLAVMDSAEALIVCSITGPGLCALQTLMRIRRTRVPVVVIPHSVLTSVLGRRPRKAWRLFTDLRQQILWSDPSRLHYVALGASIFRQLGEAAPAVAARFSVMELPCFWATTETLDEITRPGTIRIGYLGVASGTTKGLDWFARLSSDIPSQASPVQWVLVGSYRGPMNREDLAGIEGISSTPLSRQEYAQRANSLAYTIWMGDARHYRLTASASFLDGLSHLKPCICLRNPYTEHCFERMGDVGYLCDTYEEIHDLVLSLLASFPLERYRQQCRNTLRGQSIFAPSAVAPQLRAIVDSRATRRRHA